MGKHNNRRKNLNLKKRIPNKILPATENKPTATELAQVNDPAKQFSNGLGDIVTDTIKGLMSGEIKGGIGGIFKAVLPKVDKLMKEHNPATALPEANLKGSQLQLPENLIKDTTNGTND